jgi:iron complex outermembrane receptor protein
MKAKFIIWLMFGAAVLGFGAGAARAQSAGGTVSGTVTYAFNGTPLHNVTVTLLPIKLSAETDDAGRYVINNAPAGVYTLLAHFEGFPDVAQSVSVTAGGAVTLDVQMQITGAREQVTVTATGNEQATFDAVESVTTLASTQILEQAGASLGEVLDRQPGVAKRSFGPGSSRPVIRGFDGDRVLVLQDGIRNGSLGSQSGDHGEPLDPLAVERLEVVRGPATLLYGSNALGGVVNAVSGRDEGRHEGGRGYFSTFAGTTNNTAGVSGGIEYGRGSWLVFANGTGQRAGDYGTPAGPIFNSASRNGNGSGGFGYYGEKGFFNAQYSYDNRRFGIPFAAQFEVEKENFGGGAEEPEQIDLTMRTSNLRFVAGFRDSGSFVNGGKFTVNYTRYRHEELEGAEVGTLFKNGTTAFRGVFDQKRYGKWSGTFGFDGFVRNYETIGAEALAPGNVRQNSFSVFALQEYGGERAKLQFGGRVENNRYRPDDNSRPNRSFTGFSGSAGARFNLWPGGAFVANYTHAERAPALEELYNEGPHIGTLAFEIGDSALIREKSDGVDLSLRHSSPRFRFEGNLYYYKLRDFIFLALTGKVEDGLPVANYTQGGSRFSGTEVNFEAQAAKSLWLNAGVDYVSARLTAGNGMPLPRIPPLRARFGLDYRVAGLSLRPEVVFAGDQTRLFTNETRTAGYGVVNIVGSYTIARPHYAHIFSVNGFNLNNRLYRNHLSFIKDLAPEIGRGARFSYTLRFF